MTEQQFVDCPFVVAVDTREQIPYRFENIISDKKFGSLPVRVETKPATIKSGDYSILEPDDLRTVFAIERKSIADFVQTIVRSRERFVAELARLDCLESAHVVVETDWRTILDRCNEYTRAPAKTIHRSVLAWSIDFPNVNWHFATHRAGAEITAFRIMELFWKRRRTNARTANE